VRDAGEAAFLLQTNGETVKNILSQNGGGALPFVTQSFYRYVRINQNNEAFRNRIFTEWIGNLHEAGADGAECVHTEIHLNQCIADTGIHLSVALSALKLAGVGAHLRVNLQDSH
jgi:hypothetical protein